MAQRNGKDWQMRQRLAQQAAQILVENGTTDYYAAKRKAALHLGAVDTRNMPSNSEIDQALREYQRIFRADTQPQQLQRLRQVAIQAMSFFTDFKPRLVGSVLDGTADVNSMVVLHVFAHAAEELAVFLLQHEIPYELAERRLRITSDKIQAFPSYRFMAEETKLELIVFPLDGSPHPPLSPVDGRPMQRADRAAVEKLLEDSPAVEYNPQA